MESGEHMPDKQQFVNELVRVIAPGGRVIIVTWCAMCRFAWCFAQLQAAGLVLYWPW